MTTAYSCFLGVLLSFLPIICWAQTPAQKIKAHIERFERDSIPFSEAYLESLKKLSEWAETNEQIRPEYFELTDKYLSYITPQTYRKYVGQVHEDIIGQAVNILQASRDQGTDMSAWTYSLLPEYYAAVKVLIPADVARKATLDMAKERPQELIGQFSRLDYALDATDLQQAILSSPHLFSQFMHYNNLVKSQLQASKDPNIQLLFSIYQKYRYSNNAYFLLPYITRNQLTIEQADELSKNEYSLINKLLPLVIDSTPLAATSIQQRWDELMGKYMKKVKQYKYATLSTWKMDALEQVSDTTRASLLFITHTMLSPQELDAFMRWISLRHYTKPLQPAYIDKIPLKEIITLYDRVQHDNLKEAWAVLWGSDSLKTYVKKRRAEANPEQLASIQKSSIYTPGGTITSALPKPKEPEYIIKTYYFNLPEEEKILIKWKNDPLTALEKVSNWIDASYAPQLLQHIAQTYPLELVRNLDQIKLKKHGIEALKLVGKEAPLSAKNFIIQPTHPWNYLFRNSTDSIIRTLYKINEVAGINTRAYLLLDDIYRGKISIADADSLCKDSNRLQKRLIQLISNPDVLGKYSIEQELSSRALRFVRHLNISENTDKYFSDQMQNLTPDELYTFMTYGEDEIIEKGFLKMLQQLISRVPDGNIYPLMQKLGFNQYKKFLRKCAYYGSLETVLRPMSGTQKNDLVVRMLQKMETASEDEAIQVADIIISLSGSGITEQIHQQLKKEYERSETAKLDKGVAIYGILSSLLSTKVERGWAKYVAEKYELPGLDLLPSYSLFNQQMVNIQQYYFYNDEDGLSSYSNFIRSYERSPLEWEIKDLGTFVLIQSRTGRKVEIYSNKARDGEKGITDMIEYMKKNNLEPLVVVHRGLSTHTLKTFTRIPKSAKLILDGSCGGYHVQQVAIDRAPGAQILCNRNIGTMHINDPLFKQINDDIRAGKDILWPDFWSRMNNRVGNNPYFRDYIPPHKNAAAILIKALYDILEIN